MYINTHFRLPEEKRKSIFVIPASRVYQHLDLRDDALGKSFHTETRFSINRFKKKRNHTDNKTFFLCVMPLAHV